MTRRNEDKCLLEPTSTDSTQLEQNTVARTCTELLINENTESRIDYLVNQSNMVNRIVKSIELDWSLFRDV